MNPKKKFLKELMTLVGKFESETGVEINNIDFKRINITLRGAVTEETMTTKIELEMR